MNDVYNFFSEISICTHVVLLLNHYSVYSSELVVNIIHTEIAQQVGTESFNDEQFWYFKSLENVRMM